jgi:hypothetical protein
LFSDPLDSVVGVSLFPSQTSYNPLIDYQTIVQPVQQVFTVVAEQFLRKGGDDKFGEGREVLGFEGLEG